MLPDIYKRLMRHHLGRSANAGQALVELVLVLLILLVLLFGMIDFGRAIMTRQIMVNVSREAANLASRGTSLTNTLVAVVNSAKPLALDADGYVIVTAVARDDEGRAYVVNQMGMGGAPRPSRVGAGAGEPATLPNNDIPTAGQILVAAEVFYTFSPITPVGRLLNIAPTSQLYDAAYF
jgi:hypothetical protein